MLPEERNTNPATSGNSFVSKLTYASNWKIRVKFQENYLKQDKVSFTQSNVVNVFVIHESNTW